MKLKYEIFAVARRLVRLDGHVAGGGKFAEHEGVLFRSGEGEDIDIVEKRSRIIAQRRQVTVEKMEFMEVIAPRGLFAVGEHQSVRAAYESDAPAVSRINLAGHGAPVHQVAPAALEAVLEREPVHGAGVDAAHIEVAHHGGASSGEGGERHYAPKQAPAPLAKPRQNYGHKGCEGIAGEISLGDGVGAESGEYHRYDAYPYCRTWYARTP